MEHCRHEDSIALVKSVLRLPNCGYRFHAFKGGAILGRHEDSIALVKSVLRLPNCGYRFHAFKGGAILGRHSLSRVVLRDSEVGRKGGLVSMIDGLASGKRFTGRCCETVIGFCPYPMMRDLELHSLASVNGSEGDCREGDSEETLKRIY